MAGTARRDVSSKEETWTSTASLYTLKRVFRFLAYVKAARQSGSVEGSAMLSVRDERQKTSFRKKRET